MNLEEIISIVTLKKIDENRFAGQNYHTSWEQFLEDKH